jgi:hypothetical protein
MISKHLSVRDRWAAVIIGLMLFLGLISQYVRQVTLQNGPLADAAKLILAFTDSVDHQWILAIVIGIYYLALTALRFEQNIVTSDELSFFDRYKALLPEFLLLFLISWSALFYALDYSRAYKHEDFLALLCGLTAGQLTAALRLFPKSKHQVHLFDQAVMIIFISIIFVVSLIHPSMGEHFRYLGKVRWSGPFLNPNTYGLVMGIGIILTIGQYLRLTCFFNVARGPNRVKSMHFDKNKLLGWLYLIAIVVMSVGLLKSFSRGAWLGTFCGFVYLVFVLNMLKRFRLPYIMKKTWSYFMWARYGKLIPNLLVLLFSILLLCLMNVKHSENAYLRRVCSVINAYDFSWQNRYITSLGALQVIYDHPLTGVGWNHFNLVYSEYYQPVSLFEGDAINLNGFLTVGMILGLPGIFIFVAYIYLCFISDHSKEAYLKMYDFQELGDRAVFRSALIVLVVGFVFDNGPFYIAIGIPFWILIILSSGIVRKTIRN